MLLHFDTVRGEHSTGVAVVDNDDSVNLYKEVGLPQDLYKTYNKEFTKGLLPMEKVKAVIGHNRFATQGEIVVDNAHPFDMGRVVGAHNGTVFKYSMSSLTGYNFQEMDSKIIYKHLSATKDVQKLWDKADGAMALTWWDKDDKKLHIVRNKERPLFYVFSEDGKKMYWASEDWMLWVGLHRSGIKMGPEKIKSIAVDKHYLFSLGEDGKIVEESEVLTPFVPPVYTKAYSGGYSINNHNHFKASNNHNNQGQSKKRKKVNPAEGTISFLLDGWVSVTTDNHGVESGYFTACSTRFESVRVIVPVVSEEDRRVMTRVDNGEYVEWSVKTQLAKYAQDKKSQEWVWVVNGRDVKKEDSSKVVVIGEARAKDFDGNFISQDTWMKNTSDGCNVCKKFPLYRNRHSIVWLSKHSFLCEGCADKRHKEERTLTQVGSSVVNKSEWENLTRKGCCQCTSPVFWEERNEVAWNLFDTGWEVTCPTCIGVKN